ncbi:MAG: hypothetical protein KDB26_08545 [Microthrixaceae bacterium]|nr:hypothetical protein [Microthrixaceae bacterium]
MQYQNSSTTSGNAPLSDVGLENLHVSRETHMHHVANIGAWAVMGSVETSMCRRCRSDLRELVDKALWDVIASAAEGALNNAADLDAAKMRISNAMMDVVWDEHCKLEGRWRTEGVRKRYDPPAMPKLIPFGGWRPEPDCAESIPCYMRVEVTA